MGDESTESAKRADRIHEEIERLKSKTPTDAALEDDEVESPRDFIQRKTEELRDEDADDSIE